MRTIVIRTNTITRENYDKDGDSFENLMPEISYRSSVRIMWYLYTQTPNANELGVDIEDWTADTSYTGCSALLSCDNDWVRKLEGKLVGSITSGTAIYSVTVTLASASNSTIPAEGTVTLVNSFGESEEYIYSARTISGTSVTYTVDATPTKSFADGDTVRVSQEMLFQAAMNAEASTPASGIFVFDVSANSEKLSKLAENSQGRTIANIGLELLPFYTESNIVHELPAFLLETLGLTITIGDAHASPQITTEIANTIAALVAQGISSVSGRVSSLEDELDPTNASSVIWSVIKQPEDQIQYSADGENWHSSQLSTDLYYHLGRTVNSVTLWGVAIPIGRSGVIVDNVNYSFTTTEGQAAAITFTKSALGIAYDSEPQLSLWSVVVVDTIGSAQSGGENPQISITEIVEKTQINTASYTAVWASDSLTITYYTTWPAGNWIIKMS